MKKLLTILLFTFLISGCASLNNHKTENRKPPRARIITKLIPPQTNKFDLLVSFGVLILIITTLAGAKQN